MSSPTFSTTSSIRRSLMLFFLRPVGRRGENQPRYFFRLIHLHKVASSTQEEEIRVRKQLMKLLCHTSIEVWIARSENDSNGPFKFFELGRCYSSSPYRAHWSSIELSVEQWDKLISNTSIPEESPNLPPIHSPKDRMIEHRRHAACDVSHDWRREEKYCLRWPKRRHRTVIGVEQDENGYVVRMLKCPIDCWWA